MNFFDKLISKVSTPKLDTNLPEPPLQGLQVIRVFSTDDEPKVVDYPKGKYQAYWETVVGEVPGGYTAVVRFYGYRGSEHIGEEHIFTEPEVRRLRPKVHELIRTKMETFRR